VRFLAKAVPATLAVVAACARAGTQAPPPLLPPPVPVVEAIELSVMTGVRVPDLDDLDLSALEPAPFQDAPGDSRAGGGQPVAGLDLTHTGIPLFLNDRVQSWIDVFTGRERQRFALYLTRQGQFEAMILAKLEERGMPQELLYLALIESGYSPIARSRARAVGMWQFMAATARIEGLVVSEFLDERRDVERATDAALKHLTKLHQRYGSWYLAAAAYNSGAGRVDRALKARARGATGSDSLYWLIHASLPRETREYVPKLVAATVIAKNRAAFGFDDVVPLAPEAHDRVTIPDATDFDVIAEAAGVDAAVVAALNPHLPRHVTPPGRSVQVRLPMGTGDAFQLAYDQIPPEKRVRFRTHVVSRGQTLGGIAARYGTSVRVLQDANGIRNAGRISIGQRIRIPSAGSTVRVAAAAAKPAGPSAAPSTETYRVRTGDSIWTIARRKGVSTADLLRWNKLTEKSIIRPGDRLVIRYGS